MRRKLCSWVIACLSTSILILTCCNPAANSPTNSPVSSITNTSEASPFVVTEETEDPTLEPTKTVEEKATASPTPTQPQPTKTPSITFTPTWVFHEAGGVTAPVLLYHHVSDNSPDSRYYVSISNFREQMETLYINGYTPITMKVLLDAIIYGCDLPEKPIVITFDDGHHSVYENAFPIMQEYNFPGVFYIVASRINNVDNFVNVTELNEMIASGWEIGSHSYTHADLTQSHDNINYELAQSKLVLEKALNIKIETIAYPYGAIDSFVAAKVSDYGYRAGIGLGISITHNIGDIFYINRREVYSYLTIDEFLALLQDQ